MGGRVCHPTAAKCPQGRYGERLEMKFVDVKKS